MEQAGCFLSEIATLVNDGVHEDDAVERAVGAKLARGMRLAGFGHRLHRDGDPRAARLFMLARDENVAVDEVRRLLKIGEEVRRRTGRTLPVNATGAAAAILLGIGVPWQLHRGFAVASRIAGLLAHIGEEIVRPLSPAIRDELRRASWLSEGGYERDSDGDL
jgi:citrate synthase